MTDHELINLLRHLTCQYHNVVEQCDDFAAQRVLDDMMPVLEVLCERGYTFMQPLEAVKRLENREIWLRFVS